MAVGEADPPRTGAPRPLPGGGTPDGADLGERLRERLRVLACCLTLTALAFATRPGEILADTKIDMAVNPLGFLGRALHLWDPEQFGQLQNQAVGYLFPMGPFFALGDVAGMPAWITQRLWTSLLLCVAFVGMWRLAGRLGIGGPSARMFAAMAYALAPNGLATLGQISSEYMPVAMLPWIVLPLAAAASGETGRVRAAARSGLAIACCGGINATATVAVLVVPFLYVLTRPRGSFRMRLLAWWSAASAAATAWWLVPLLLTGTYGFSWLTYTEKAETTTGPTGVINVLRGAERWVNYLFVDGQVWWPVGHALSVSPLPILFTGAVAALGLAGLLGRLLPERTFLVVTLLAGVAIMSAGHLGDLPGPFAAQVRDLLDGPLAPLRNLHKFDAVVRLPLALGLAHLLAVATVRHREGRARDGRVRSLGGAAPAGARVLRALVSLPVAAAVALGGVGVTAVSHGLSGPGEFQDVPKYWRDAASWLNARAGQQGVLAVPGAPFGEYLWGRPMDDIVQPLLTARWGVRQLVPAGSPGYTRALDAIDLQVRSGRGSAGLSAFLGRMGIRYVLVRNDLRRETLRGGWPARVHQTLEDSPGLRRVAAFGGPVGFDTGDAVSAADQAFPALEVYEVEGAAAVANLAEASSPVRVYGGPESLLAMADDGALPEGPVLLNDDAPGLEGRPVVTDSPRLIRRHFGELHLTSPTMTAAHRREATDVLDDGWKKYATHVTYGGGVRDITASSSASDEDGVPQTQKPDAMPYAAFDGNQFTAWETGGWDGPVGQWLRVDFDEPKEVPSLMAAFVQNAALGPPVTRVQVETEGGTVAQDVERTALPQPLRAPEGPTRWLRLRITRLASEPAVPAFARAGVAELSIGGVNPTRTFTLPAPSGIDGPATYVMDRRPGARDECMEGAQRRVCSPSLGSGDEEGAGFDRTFTSAAAGRVPVTGTAVLTDPALIERYTAVAGQPAVSATSTISRHPSAQPRSGFDGDPATTWVASDEEDAPAFAVRWRRPARLSTITLQRPPGASGPVRLRIEGAGEQVREGLTDAQGRLSFAPMTTDRLKITIFRESQVPPVQVTDLVIPGVQPLPDVRTYPLKLPCGYGPKLRAGPAGTRGSLIQTRAVGTLGDLLAGRPLTFTACRRATLAEGANRLAAEPLDAFRIDTVTVGAKPAEEEAAGAPRPVKIRSWGPGSRELEVDAAATSFLMVNENFNEGWTAAVGGKELRPVRLDGWKQGWIVPAGTSGVVELTYGPDRAQRIAVVVGLNLLLLLLIVAVWPRRAGDRGGTAPPVRAAVAGTGWPAWAAVGLAAALGGWIAGAPGLAVAAAVAAGCGWARTRRSAAVRALASPWTIAVAMLAGAGCLAAGAWLDLIDNPGSPSGALGDLAPQLLGVAIVGRIAAELWRPPPAGGDSRGPIALSWTAPGQGPGENGHGGSATGPAARSGGSSASPLRWTPRPSAEDPSPRPPGKPGPRPRTRQR
ncbi:arabinofuranan 3-O-arabinosyltransferase [Actinomadura hallensis]|uniref:Arabinofuranan 3-O-arabinosyltransferase n=1 Tax=Actinomadura hallensis TaxID=337895 RepID=A0A543IA34_9ACTN|nr:alpha-(1->3)-arabinofuranosyltransferase family protein [Actinomadura hallensis]TQM67451.1 arabinofuranan 3-O-arabinosyltransferase [Actinomadura hallensis]